jgi:hypothetical protein
MLQQMELGVLALIAQVFQLSGERLGKLARASAVLFTDVVPTVIIYKLLNVSHDLCVPPLGYGRHLIYGLAIGFEHGCWL